MISLSEKYFWRWRDVIAGRRYQEWCEIQDELAAEAQFAMNNDMETEFWCWNCKHSECDRHKLQYLSKSKLIEKPKKTPCAGKTQRGRNCHIHASTYRHGMFFCEYHF